MFNYNFCCDIFDGFSNIISSVHFELISLSLFWLDFLETLSSHFAFALFLFYSNLINFIYPSQPFCFIFYSFISILCLFLLQLLYCLLSIVYCLMFIVSFIATLFCINKFSIKYILLLLLLLLSKRWASN